MDKSEVKYKLQQAEKTRVLSLPNLNLFKVPEGVWALDLVRLDLSRNSLSALSPAVARLKQLQQLWVNDNPLQDLPEELSACKQLRVLDVSHTLVRSIRRDLSLLAHLVELNMDGCPLKPSLAAVYSGGMVSVVAYLRRKYDRKVYKNQLFQRLRETMYPEADPIEVMNATCAVFDALKDVDTATLKLFLHNTTRVFPEKLSFVDTSAIRSKLDTIRGEMTRKAEMSKLKLKLKARYPTEPAEQLHALSDMLTSSFPPDTINTIFKAKLLAKRLEEISVEGLKDALGRFEQTITDELAILQVKLASKLQNVYGEALPLAQAQALSSFVTQHVRNPRQIRKLLLETGKFLPEDRSTVIDGEALVRALLPPSSQTS